MYAHFYQLSENPFNLTPDPKFHYINESTREAMAAILHGLKGRKGFLTLIGEAGTGKTTLLKRILDEIEGETQVVFVFNPGVSFDELLEFICMELGISTDGRRRLQLIERLNAHLLQQLTAGRNVVVMIDEAQTLEDDVLEELRLLSNLETSKEKILQILLSGQPELEEKLRKPSLRQLRQRIAVRATLKPMRPDEIGPYVETRLRSAGAERNDFFTPPALRKVWQASRGIPRVVNVVCDNAMMIAFAEGKRRITSRVMSEAIRDLHGAGGGFFDSARGWLATPGVRYAAGALVGLALAVPFAMSMVPGNGDEAARSGSATHVAAPAAAPAATQAQGGPAAAGEAQRQEAFAQDVPPEADFDSAGDAPSHGLGAADRIDGAIRDSMRRAEVVARSTAARLYPSQRRGVDDAAKGALTAPSPEPGSDEDVENRARASLDEPVHFERNEAPIDLDPKIEGEAIASLRAPLAREETHAFHPGDELEPLEPGDVDADADAFVGDEFVGGDELEVRHEAPQPQPKAAPAPAAEAPRPAPAATEKPANAASAAAGTRPEPKPVKAGSLDLDAAAPAAVAPTATQPPLVTSGAEDAHREASSGLGAPGTKADVAARNEEKALAETGEEVGPPVFAGTSPEPAAAADDGRLAAAVAPAGVETGLRSLGPSAAEPIVGQLVRVLPNDTVWDIAVAYYGTAGPATLKRILNGNPGIRDPRHLEVGSHIYLPFQRPEQMVLSGSEGTYRVLLAVSPEKGRLDAVRSWVAQLIADPQFTTSVVRGAERTYQLHLVGVTSRDDAMRFATTILDEHDRMRRVAARRPA